MVSGGNMYEEENNVDEVVQAITQLGITGPEEKEYTNLQTSNYIHVNKGDMLIFTECLLLGSWMHEQIL